MKKSVIIISAILLVIIIVCVIGISMNAKKIAVVKQENKEYEQYLSNDIYGADVVTLINKAIDSNKKNNIQVDEKENYIDNNKDSIIIELVLITNEQKEKTKAYRMEKIAKVGIDQFISNFNTASFKITKIDYHKETGKIKYIEISQE